MTESDIERLAFTEFEPLPEGGFRYIARTYFDGATPEERQKKTSPQESVRLSWLKTYLGLNGMCPNGYEINSRISTKIIDSHYTQYQILYQGVCIE